MLTQKDGYVQLVQQGADRTDAVPSPEEGNLVMYATSAGVVVENSDGNQAMLDIPTFLELEEPLTLATTWLNVASFTAPAGSNCGYEIEINLTGTLEPDTTSTCIVIGVSVNEASPTMQFVVPSANPVDTFFGGSYRFLLPNVAAASLILVVARKLVTADVAEVSAAEITVRRFARLLS